MFEKTVFSLKGIKGALVVQCIIDILVALTTIGVALSLSQIILSLWNGLSFESQLINIAIFVICFVTRGLFNSLADVTANSFSDNTCKTLNEEYLRSVYLLGPRFTKDQGSSYLVSLATEGLDGISTYLATFLVKLPKMIIIPISLLIVIGYLDIVSLLICAVSYPLIIIFMQLIGIGAKAKSNERLAGFKAMSNHFIDSVRGIDEIKTFGLVDKFASTIYKASEKYRELTMKTLRIATLSSSVLDLFATGALAAVAIMLGFRMVDGDVTFFNGLAILVMVPEFFNPIKSYASDHHANLDGRNYLTKLLDVIHEGDVISSNSSESEPNNQDDHAFNNLVDGNATQNISATSSSHNANKLEKCSGKAIVAKNISFSYDDQSSETSASKIQTTGIENVSFEIPFQKTTAIVGKSGLGKTTLANLISGFLTPQSGHFEIDEKTVTKLNQPDWQRRISFIPQIPTIFNQSLKDNIAFYRTEASYDDVKNVIELVGLSSLVKDLDDDIDTLIGDDGIDISGGEAARIAIARALIDDSRDIWIFDEPGAHLDEETSSMIWESIRKLAHDKTVIIITHEKSWEDVADNVIDLDDIGSSVEGARNV